MLWVAGWGTCGAIPNSEQKFFAIYDMPTLFINLDESYFNFNHPTV